MMDREDVFSELMETVYKVSRKVSAYESIPRKYGIEDKIYMVEAHTINLIGNEKHTTASQLAMVTNKSKSSVSQIIDKLIKKDLVTALKNPEDNRKLILKLTDKGRHVYEYHKKLDKKEYDILLNKLDQFSTEDFLHYIKISTVLLENID
jgi:DNA-binding MarR family transcriptional regulator